MKLKKWMYGALALGLFGACSNDDVPSGGGNVITHNGDYMAIDIKLPTVPSTRAANDNYDDGKSEEYKVSNGCLLIFKGADPNNATFAAAYGLSGLSAAVTPDGDENKDGDGNTIYDNITSQYRKTVKLDNLSYDEENDNLYAFVMLNYTGVAELTKDASSGDYNNNIIVNGTPLKVITTGDDGKVISTQEKTFTDLCEMVAENPRFNTTVGGVETNFFMCNAPLSTVSSENGQAPTAAGLEIITLVGINKEKIFPTQAEAEMANNSACTVNVERALAKATLNWKPTGFEPDSKGNTLVAAKDGGKISFAFVGWALDVTEPSSYIVRNTKKVSDWWDYNNEKANNYRFIGGVKIGALHNTAGEEIEKPINLYRTYWCVDPHYNTNLIAPNSTDHKNPTEFADKSKIFYCNENTFDVAHQNYRNTTRAVFQLTLAIGKNGETTRADGNVGTTFYVLNGVENEIYTDLKEVETYPRALIYESDIVKNALNAALKENTSYDEDVVENMVNITFVRNSKTGIREVSDIKFKKLSADELSSGIFAKQPVLDAAPAAGEEATTPNKDLLIQQANTEYVITEYENGNTYYDLRFMHFASETNEAPNDLAPWNIQSQVATTTQEAYPGADAANNWLGRYGMVRNNWYDLEITKVTKLGSPVVPDVNGSRGDTSDDNKENYMSFKINVLSWAKRTQKHEF